MGILSKIMKLGLAAAIPLRLYRQSKEPHFPIHRGIRITKKNPEEQKILIIGAGIVGCSAAYYLAKHTDKEKTKIEVLDSKEQPCQGATEWNGRHINENVGLLYAIKYTELLRNLLRDPSQTSMGIDPLVFFETGGFKFMVQQFLSRFDSKLKEEIIRVQKLLGERAINTFWPVIEDMESIIGPSLKSRLKVRETTEVKAFPFIHKGQFHQEHSILTQEEAKQFCQSQGIEYDPQAMKTIVKIPGAKVVESRELGRSLLQASMSTGNVTMKNGVSMTGWIADRSGRILGIDTPDGEIYADKIIICGGVHSKFMLKPLGIVIPLLGGKGYSLNLTEKLGGTRLPPLTQTFADLGWSLYHNKAGGDLRQSGMFEFATFDNHFLDPRKIERLKRLLQLRFKLNAADFELNEWTHHRPCVPADMPVVGSIPNHKNVFIVSGTSAKGVTWCQVGAQIMTAQLTGKENEVTPIYEAVAESVSPKRYVNFI